MHLSIDRLLAIRDSAPTDIAHLEHLRSCAECSQTLAGLRSCRDALISLADIDPPASAWNDINQRLNRPAVRRNYRAIAAIASVAVLAVISVVIISNRNSSIPTVQSAQSKQVANQVADPVSGTSATAELVAQSQELEEVLHQLPKRPYVQRAATAEAIDDLETSIQLVDAQLASADVDIRSVRSEQLWRQRVELMSSLVNVRYAQASAVSL
jgi:hypothetical protein